MANNQLFTEINLGVGDHVFYRIFLDTIKDRYNQIFVTHSRDALAFWFANNQIRKEFNNKLASLIFAEPPYVFVPEPRMRFPFFPNERIVKELNDKPTKPNLNCLCVGKSLDIKDYIVITTKVREFPKTTFDQYKSKLATIFKSLADKYAVVILGEREVQKTREYTAECNRDKVFGIYDFLIETLSTHNILDLTVPALGNTTSPFPQFQQDCLILKEAKCIITFGIGGNFWSSLGVGSKVVALRADNEPTTDLIYGYPTLSLTKNIDEFVQYLSNLTH